MYARVLHAVDASVGRERGGGLGENERGGGGLMEVAIGNRGLWTSDFSVSVVPSESPKSEVLSPPICVHALLARRAPDVLAVG